MAAKIFLCYRRDESAGYAARVRDSLEREFGGDLLFIDMDGMPTGSDVTALVHQQVATCQVLLAIIGPDWLDARDEAGMRRLDDPNDFVRIEIVAALARDIAVIPTLLDGAEMPKADQLPNDLKQLSRRNWLDVRHASFHSDIDRLVRRLKMRLGQAANYQKEPGRHPLRPLREWSRRREAWPSDDPFFGPAVPLPPVEGGGEASSWRRLRRARSVGSGPTPRVIKSEYVVWYGTNRCVDRSEGGPTGYSAERDTKVHYGMCRVYIPKAHKIGSLGSRWWKRLLTWTDDRLRLMKIKQLHQESFWQQIASQLSKLGLDERHAVIFVHGYNVSFKDAALRAAQIGFDLSINGAMAFFSWPSRGTLGGYMADAATIEASEQDITNFMIDFVFKSGAEAVHIIAHSMGNRGVLRAVNRIAGQAQQRSGVPFGQVILAAADVDSDTFRQLSGAYTQIARRTTLYVSARDRAVEASHWLHQFPRVGLMPPICVASGIDTIGVANVDLTLLGHGYIGEAREVLTDMHQLITTGTPPERRFGLTAASTPQGERYWLIRG
jgi:esterase/lipase superfamily enzyme